MAVEVATPTEVSRPAEAPAVVREHYSLARWLTTTDHKRIGCLYIVTTMLFFLLGGLAALAVRIQLALPEAPPMSPAVYNQVFTVHGSLMIFLYIIPILSGGFGNYVVP